MVHDAESEIFCLIFIIVYIALSIIPCITGIFNLENTFNSSLDLNN